jgi:Reverse transcriptase (RNA-dependent DNA polymerase)
MAQGGVSEDGQWSETKQGTPQGAVVSPLLANVYLHYVFDLWADAWRRKVATGDVIIVRYADDLVMGFQHRAEAVRFLEEFKERLAKFGLELHPEKTRLIEFGRYAAHKRKQWGKGKPETFTFLGFTHYCGRRHKTDTFTVWRITAKQRMVVKLKAIKVELLRRKHDRISQVGAWLRKVVTGYYQYHAEHEIGLDGLLPALDIWLNVPLTKIQYVVHILPALDWRGGALGVRLKYQFKDIGELKADYLLHRNAALAIADKGKTSEAGGLEVWPRSLTDYLERRFRGHIVLESYALDPALLVKPDDDAAIPQKLRDNALPLNKNPFKGLIRIDEIAAQRDFADAGEKDQGEATGPDFISRRFKRKLSDQLRVYYDRHLGPNKTPDEDDYDALGAIQKAERSFDNKLKLGFGPAIRELEDLGYPGIANPKLRISTQLRATDGLRHGTAVQYQILDPSELRQPAATGLTSYFEVPSSALSQPKQPR